jgi:hypothetical protein
MQIGWSAKFRPSGDGAVAERISSEGAQGELLRQLFGLDRAALAPENFTTLAHFSVSAAK